MDADAEVTAEAVDEAIAEELDSGGEEEAPSAIVGGRTERAGSKTNLAAELAPIESKVDPAEWKLEVERVTPYLKVVLAEDHKDWRLHLQQMKDHQTVRRRGIY